MKILPSRVQPGCCKKTNEKTTLPLTFLSFVTLAGESRGTIRFRLNSSTTPVFNSRRLLRYDTSMRTAKHGGRAKSAPERFCFHGQKAAWQKSGAIPLFWGILADLVFLPERNNAVCYTGACYPGPGKSLLINCWSRLSEVLPLEIALVWRCCGFSIDFAKDKLY